MTDATRLGQELDNYIIVDVGANLTNKKFGRDLDSVIQRAKDAGISKIMVTGTSVQGSKDALRLSRLYPGTLYATAGVHPHDAKSWGDEDQDTLSILKDLLCNPEVVAVVNVALISIGIFPHQTYNWTFLRNRSNWLVR